MICLIGLGNYPEKYHKTRHNFGFLAIDYLVHKFDFSDFKYDKRFSAEISTGMIDGQKIICVKPQTYMNVSGKSAGLLKQFYKLEADDFFIFSDDLDLEFGIDRFRAKGSAGGQNGIKDIIKVLGSSEIRRVKFGIGSEMRQKMPTENFVLSKFTEEEFKEIPAIIEAGIQKFRDNLVIS